ncbi:transketolase [Gluconacetobacter johannae DSM 13595]|uniref:Transketolase n=1 Tax=Gluconacetobacter johannae TaxID=112140 RepID=A0A7W4J7H0_9PROT|nr:transketolase C-terminal domain-containing protein [Gluconacetobacter johannae]MBB2176110.1 transketolase [Gluconacetobacter johannae]GBQ85683.1 transketolase [Gluconacetobacter johannae DSM 13595]
MRSVVAEGLVALAEADERVWLLTGDLGFSVMEPFAARFPDRFINVGIAEQNMAGIAAGLAMTGRKVFCWSIVNFAVIRCLEQIRNDIVAHGADVTVIGIGGGFAYGSHGYTHHGVEDLAMTRVLPGITVAVPADPAEAAWVLAALGRQGGPAYLRLNKGGEPTLHETSLDAVPFGPMLCLRPGRDGAFLATGPVTGEALAAASLLAGQGIDMGVWSVPVIQPLDRETLTRLAKDLPLLVTVEEHVLSGGLGGAVAEAVAELPGPRAQVLRAGMDPAQPSRNGGQEDLRRTYRLDSTGLAERVLSARNR